MSRIISANVILPEIVTPVVAKRKREITWLDLLEANRKITLTYPTPIVKVRDRRRRNDENLLNCLYGEAHRVFFVPETETTTTVYLD